MTANLIILLRFENTAKRQAFIDAVRSVLEEWNGTDSVDDATIKAWRDEFERQLKAQGIGV